MESHHNLDITALIAENKIEQAAKLLAQSPEYKKPIDIKLAYCLSLTDMSTLKKILKSNGYKIDFATRFEKEPYLESLFWQRLAEADEWSTFSKLVKNNDIHIEPSSEQRHTIFTTLVTKKQFKLYLQIVNKLLLQHPTLPLENLVEVSYHFNQFRDIFKLELFKHSDQNFFEVLRLFLRTKENFDALNSDIENNELFLLAFNEHQVERNEFINWLLENERYKKFNLNIDPSFLEAINGKIPKPMADGEFIFDEFGFTPQDYAVICGAKKIESNSYFYRKGIGYNSPPFWEKLLACSPLRLIELIIERKAWDVLELFNVKQLKRICFPKKGRTSLLTELAENNQIELLQKIFTHNKNFHVSKKRLLEYAQISAKQYGSYQQTNSSSEYSIRSSLSSALDILKTLNVKDDKIFRSFNYEITFDDNNSIPEQVFFTKLAQLSAQANDWTLFAKIVENNRDRHHIQPTATRKKTLLTDLVENNQYDLFYQILDKYLKEHKDATKEDLQEVSQLILHSVGQLDDKLTYLRLAIKCELQLPNILCFLLKDRERCDAHLNFLLQDDNYLKLDPSLQKESILACLGKSTKSPDELARLPLDSMGLSPYHYLVLSGNKKPLNIKKDFMTVIDTYRTPNTKLIDIACAFNPEYCISALIEQKDWELLRKVVTSKNGEFILSQRGYTSFLTTLAASGKWDIYYDCVTTHFNLISSPEYYLRFNEVIRNILEHRVVDHGRLFFAIADQFPKHELLFEKLQPWFNNNFTTVKPVAQKKSTVTAPAHKNESTRSDLTNMLTSLSMSNYMTALKQSTSDMGNIHSKQTTSANSTVKPEEKPQKSKTKSRATKPAPKVEIQKVEITDADIAEVKAILSAAFTSNLFSCDCTLSNDKSCVITLSGDKTALQFVTAFLKSKSLLKFASSLQQQPQQENQIQKYKKIITLNTKQDVQLFMAAFAKTDDKDFVELNTKLQTLNPPEEPQKQQDADASSSDKSDPTNLSSDQQSAWIKGLSSVFCKNSNFKSLIKWNETEKCFEVDISSDSWTIKKYKGRKKDYQCYQIDLLDFQKYILHHITNAIKASGIATTKVSNQKTVKIYPFDETFLPISKEVHDSIFEAFKQYGTLVPMPPPAPVTQTPKEKPTPASTPNNNNNAAPTVNVPEVLKQLFCQIGGIETQNFAFLRFKQHEKHPNKWILSFSTKQVEQFDQYHSELFFEALKTTFDKHAPGFISLFGDKKEYRIRINMAKMPSDFNGLDFAFAREYEKLRFDRLLKLLLIPSGLLTETDLDELKKEQDKTDIHKWTITCSNELTEFEAEILYHKLAKIAPDFMQLKLSNNNNNNNNQAMQLIFNTNRAPSESQLNSIIESPTNTHMKEEVESPSAPLSIKAESIPTQGEVYTALVGIMQCLPDEYIEQLNELLKLIEDLPPFTGNSDKDEILQLDLDLYTTRILHLLAMAEEKYKNTVIEKTMFWDFRNLFRHCFDEIRNDEYAIIKELFIILKPLIPLASAKNVSIKINSKEEDTLRQGLEQFLKLFEEKLKTNLRQNSEKRSKAFESRASNIEQMPIDAEITTQRKEHAILQAKSISGEYLQAPKNSRKLYRKIGHKGFGIQFGLFATHLYRKYVTPPTDIQSLTFGA